MTRATGSVSRSAYRPETVGCLLAARCATYLATREAPTRVGRGRSWMAASTDTRGDSASGNALVAATTANNQAATPRRPGEYLRAQRVAVGVPADTHLAGLGSGRDISTQCPQPNDP